MAKRELTPEFREFLACLNRAGVEYLLVGGYAVTDTKTSPTWTIYVLERTLE
jgi:hypothetical protein